MVSKIRLAFSGYRFALFNQINIEVSAKISQFTKSQVIRQIYSNTKIVQ